MTDSMTPSPVPGEDTKRRRRSALTAGRRSLVDLCVPPVGELYLQVDQDLPAEDRVEGISKRAFLHALSTLGDEMKEDPDFHAFRLAAEEEVEAMMTRMRKGGLFQKASRQDKENLLPNPVNQQMDLTIQELQGHIHRLREECQRWDGLVAELERKEAAMQQKLEEREITGDKLPPHVRELAKSYLPPHANHSSLLKEVQQQVTKATLCMHSFIRDENLIEGLSKAAQFHLQELHKDLEAETFTGIYAPDSATHVISSLPPQERCDS